MLLVPRSTILVSDPVRRSRWKRSDRSWTWRKTCAGEPPRRVLADLLEHGVAQIVGQHAAEARGGIGQDQPGDDGEGGVRAHPVDRRA